MPAENFSWGKGGPGDNGQIDAKTKKRGQLVPLSVYLAQPRVTDCQYNPLQTRQVEWERGNED